MAEHRTGNGRRKIDEKNEAKIAIEAFIIRESRGSKHLKEDMPAKGIRVGVLEGRGASRSALVSYEGRGGARSPDFWILGRTTSLGD